MNSWESLVLVGEGTLDKRNQRQSETMLLVRSGLTSVLRQRCRRSRSTLEVSNARMSQTFNDLSNSCLACDVFGGETCELGQLITWAKFVGQSRETRVCACVVCVRAWLQQCNPVCVECQP